MQNTFGATGNIASELDDASERITQYLAGRHSVNINAIFFNFFRQDGVELLARSWLMDPEQVEERAETKKRAPWTGYYYVNVGEDENRNWDDHRKYGFLSAGGGDVYVNPLKKLRIGDPVFAYIKNRGYVGFGQVTQEAQRAKDFVPAGHQQRLFDLPLTTAGMKELPEEYEEWAVGVEWAKTVSRDEACWYTGAFANQNIVCKLRDPATLAFLQEKFGVEDGRSR